MPVVRFPFLLCAALLSASLLPAQPSAPPTTHPHRPQLHFSPRRHWMNDPNGLVFFEGEYHLFFQYNPQGDTPGHISWGHAVSTDLLHWHELPVAIPAIGDELVFTGSVVVDEHNTSNLCANAKPCLVAVYTAHHGDGPTRREDQDLAVSQDRGRTWTRYASNPVLNLNMPEFRDPGVSWNEISKSWLMVVSLPNEHQVAFYTSPNLKDWTRTSTFGPAAAVAGQWECPNLLHLPGKEDLWALKVGLNPGGLQGGSGEQYFLGSFDGTQFTQSSTPGSHGWTDYGKDSYCAISYNHLPAGANPTLIGWMDNWQYADKIPTEPWRGQMTLPRRVSLLHDAAGLALQLDPVIAPARLDRGTPVTATLSSPDTPVDLPPSTSPLELTLRFDPGTTQAFGLRIFSDAAHFTEIGFDRAAMHFYTDRTHSGDFAAPGFPARTDAPLVEGRPFDLHLILDRSSVEAFAQSDTIAMTNLILPPSPRLRLQFFRREGKSAVRVTGRAFRLKSLLQP